MLNTADISAIGRVSGILNYIADHYWPDSDYDALSRDSGNMQNIPSRVLFQVGIRQRLIARAPEALQALLDSKIQSFPVIESSTRVIPSESFIYWLGFYEGKKLCREELKNV